MKNQIVNVASNELFAKEAYERAKADWAALESDQLLKVNLDISIAAQTILGALPEVRALRERIVQELPTFDAAEFDKLEDYVLGLVFVHARYVMATQPPDDLSELSSAASALRERLAADARTLSLRGLFDARKVAALKGSTGYRNVGIDLQSLSAELEAVWSEIEGKCATTREELDAAAQMAVRLLRVVGVRDQAPVVLAALVEERMRAFTLVIKAWEEARAAVSYLRRDQADADSIAPSLYTGKALRKKASEPDDETDSVPGAGSPLGGGVITSPSSPATPAAPAPAPIAGPAAAPLS
ncbi:MAG: hypothetical protein EOO73_36200, partial [Myxococcales bacterium]